MMHVDFLKQVFRMLHCQFPNVAFGYYIGGASVSPRKLDMFYGSC